MSYNDNDRISRRSILRTASTGVAATSVSGLASGSKSTKENTASVTITDASGRQIDRIMRAEPIKGIRKELKKPQLGTQNDEQIEGGFNPDPSDAEHTIIHNSNDEIILDFISVSISGGKIHYDVNNDEAYLLFSDESTYPKTVHDIDVDLEPALVATGDGIRFVHIPPEDKHEEIAGLLDEDPGNVVAATAASNDGYRAVVTTDDAKDENQVSIQSIDDTETDSRSIYQIDEEIENANQVITNDEQGVSAQFFAGPCPTMCGNCIVTAAPCGACAAVCVGATGFTGGVGVGGCVLCLVHTCSTPVPICYTCVDQCSE